ncbi:MAG: ABC transporter permease [Anaerolineae bacterium]|jgi:peptide/nickel transport system permease protein
MGRYIGQRLVWLIFVLVGLSIVTFVVSHLIPADPIRAAAGMHAAPEQVEALRRKYGMDKPLPVQYVIYMGNLLQGDLGRSIRSRRPVLDDLKQYFPATIELALSALLITVLTGIPIGVLSAVWPNSLTDHLSRLLSLGGISMPSFWLGLLLQWFIYGQLGWLPAAGRLDQLMASPNTITGMHTVDSLLNANWPAFWSAVKHLILPAVTLAAGSTAMVARATRSSMLEALGQDYIRTARGKGLGEGVVIGRHALRNALIPTVTLIGLQTGNLMAGVFLVEVIFSWPGLGSYAVRSVLAVDFPAIMGVTLLIAVIYVFTNLLVDVSYAALDPRIRLEGGKA